MKISIVTGPYLPVPPLLGGATHRIWHQLANDFAKRGHAVTLYARKHGQQPAQEIIDGVEYVRVGGFQQSGKVWWDLVRDSAYAVEAVQELRPADILVVHDFWLPIIAGLVKPKAGRIIVPVGRYPKNQFRYYTRTARFVGVSEAVRKEIVRQCPALEPRTVRIPNPIDTGIFYPSQKSQAVRKEKVVLFVGRIHPEKGLELLLEAFSKVHKDLPNCSLMIVGPHAKAEGGGGEQYLEKLKGSVKQLPVAFEDPVFDAHALAQVYRAADVFCYPSMADKGEAFGVAPLEAMASGAVPVVSKLPCFKEFVTENETGLAFDHKVPGASGQLANLLDRLLASDSERERLKENGLRRAREFTVETVSARYLAAFEEVLGH